VLVYVAYSSGGMQRKRRLQSEMVDSCVLRAIHDVLENSEQFKECRFLFDCFRSFGKYSAHVGNAGRCAVRHSGVGFGLLFAATSLLLFSFGFH